MDSSASKGYLPWTYFLLVFTLSFPIWIFGGKPLPLQINLPVSALSTFVPALAAAILIYLKSGSAGVKAFIQKAWDFKQITHKIWYLPAHFLAPLIYLLSFVVMRLAGLPLPVSVDIPLLLVPVFAVMFWIGDYGEELGWSGYAIEPMQNRWGAVKASFLLGLIWASFHSIAFVQTRNSFGWVLWQSLKTIGMRMVIVWIYNKSGKSVAAANLYHATDNLSWSLLPNLGSHYNPAVTGLLTWLVVGLVLFGLKVKTSARNQRPDIGVYKR